MNPYQIIEKYYSGNEKAKQILIAHSEAVRDKALSIASRLTGKIDPVFISEAALLHDVGIFAVDAPEFFCFGSLPYIAHGYVGRELLEEMGFLRHALVCERHTGVGLSKKTIVKQALPVPRRDMIPLSEEEKLICYADKFFSKSASNLRDEKPLEKILQSLKKHGQENVEVFLKWHKKYSFN